MSTNALVTLHNLSDSAHNAITTVSFYRHCDGYIGKETANMFYNMFANCALAKGGELECFLANNAKHVELNDVLNYTTDDCNFEYHYHLDCKTFQLIVNHCEWYGDSVQDQVFNGCVVDYINEHSGDTKAVLSIADYSQTHKAVFTIDSMIRDMAKDFDLLERCCKNASNPNNACAIKRLNRYYIFLGDMNLSKEVYAYREQSLQLLMSYENVIHTGLDIQRLAAVREELNTTHIMLGDQPVALTILD